MGDAIVYKDDVVNTIHAFSSNFGDEANEYFTAGHCAEFAISLACYLNSIGVQSSIDIYIRSEVDYETDVVDSTTFSHAVVCALDTTLDITGNELEFEPWDSRFDNTVDKWGLCNSWEVLNFPFTTFDEIVNTIGPICDKYNVPYNKVHCMGYVNMLYEAVHDN